MAAAGDHLPELALDIAPVDLIRFAGAANDYVPLHWDRDLVRAQGFPDLIVHGWLTAAHLCRLVSDAFPPDRWRIARYAVRYVAPLHPGRVTLAGEVTEASADMVTIAARAHDPSGRTACAATFDLSRNTLSGQYE